MSSSDVMEELLCYKKDIEKDLEVCFLILIKIVNRMKIELLIY